MMKNKICITVLLLLICHFFQANSQELDLENKRNANVIDVAKGYNTVMIFPETIIDDILGNDLEYEKHILENEAQPYHKKIVKLNYVRQAKENNLTNYVVITSDGYIYEFWLRQNESPKMTTVEVKLDMANGNIFFAKEKEERNKGKNTQDKIIDAPYNYYTRGIDKTYKFSDVGMGDSPWYHLSNRQLDSLYRANKLAYYKIRSYKNKRDPSLGKGRNFDKASRVYLWLKGVYFNKDEIYVDLEIDNRESLDYVVDFIKSKLSTTYQQKSSKQSTNHKPIFEYNVPNRVRGGGRSRFQLVFNRFTISDKRILEIEIKEKNGERDLNIEVPKSFITNPFEI